jgi:putative transposase
MPRRATPLIAGETYHVYNRGHNRSPIFFDVENYAFFLRRLREYVASRHAVMIAYVLMPNHYHLLVRSASDELSHAMQLLSISYTKAVNTRWARTGGLFEGAFKARRVTGDEDLLHLSRYIHLNPVRAGLAHSAEAWPYSRYLDYVGQRSGTLSEVQGVLCHFRDRQDYRHFVDSYAPAGRGRIAHLLF